MLVCLLAVPSMAADTSAPNDFGIKTYVALGDSIATGLNDNTGTNQDAYGSWENGYTVKLAEKLGLLKGCKNYIPDGYNYHYYTSPNESGFRSWAFPAMRTREILKQVDASYKYEKDDFADLWLDNNELDKTLGDVPAMIQSDVSKADLITLNIGSNDVLLSQLRITAWELDDPDNGLTSGMIVDLMKSKLGFGDAPNLPEGTDENKLVAEFIPRFLVNVLKGYNEFLVNIPKILKSLRSQNPDAQIVVLGIFNPLHYSLSLTDGKLPVSLGEMIDGVMLPMNLALAADAALCGCTYVDVVDVTTDGSMHPDNDGYEDIADRIVSRLQAKTSYRDIKLLNGENQTAVKWASEIFPGISEKIFSPATFATRAQFVQALYKLQGSQSVVEVKDYLDVSERSAAYDAIQWATASGIASGITKNTFGPDIACSLKQAATFLYQYDQKFAPEGRKSSDGYSDALTWASDKGISKGISKLAMKTGAATRAQAVLMLYRYTHLS